MKTKVIDNSRELTIQQKMGFVNRMETLPKGVNKFDFLKRSGISTRKYQRWVKSYGVSSFYAPVLSSMERVNPNVVSLFRTHPSINCVGKKFLFNVSLSIAVTSIDEIKELVTNLQNVPNVHNVNSVGHIVLE
jgi:hypothetical protein